MNENEFMLVPRSEYRELVEKATKFDAIANDVIARMKAGESEYHIINDILIMSLTDGYTFQQELKQQELAKKKKQEE